jgi:hypothetical protein
MLKFQKLLLIALVVVPYYCCAENFLLRKPETVSFAAIEQLPQYWSANFGIKGGAFIFLFKDGQAALQLKYDKVLPDGLAETEKSKFERHEVTTEQVIFASTSVGWEDLSQAIAALRPEDADEDKNYYIDEPRELKPDAQNQPQVMTVQEVAAAMKDKKVLFYTGAGISVAAGVEAMPGLIALLGMNFKEPSYKYVGYVMDHEAEILGNFAAFCKRAFTAEPTAAHYALTEIALDKSAQIMTENFDFLHQRTGIMPYCVNSPSLRQHVHIEDLQEIDAVVCVALSHDDRGFLGWYKRHNPSGIIIAFDLAVPSYLGAEDVLIIGDAQETIPALRDYLK